MQHAASANCSEAPALKDLLDEFKHTCGLGVPWIKVGPSGREERPASGGVLPYYGQCQPSPERFIKSVVNAFYVDDVTMHPHNFECRCARVPPSRAPCARSPDRIRSPA